jgi:hypothetical protein
MDVRDLLKQFTTDRHILMTFAYKVSPNYLKKKLNLPFTGIREKQKYEFLDEPFFERDHARVGQFRRQG